MDILKKFIMVIQLLKYLIIKFKLSMSLMKLMIEFLKYFGNYNLYYLL